MDTPVVQPPTPPVTPPVPPPPKNNSGIFIGIFLVLLGILVGLAIDKTTILSNLRIPYFSAKPIPTPTSTPTPALTWSTYTDPTGVYTFQYPSDWNLKTSGTDEISVSDPQNFTIGFSVASKNTLSVTYPVENWVKLHTNTGIPCQEPGCTGAGNYIYESPVTINGTVFDKIIQGQSMYIITYYLYKGENIFYTITTTTFGENINTTMDQILSTFKFLDQSNAEGKFCGGIAANLPENQCLDGFYCKLDASHPDAGGKCVKK